MGDQALLTSTRTRANYVYILSFIRILIAHTIHYNSLYKFGHPNIKLSNSNNK